jgi:hypothetical protein
MRNPSGRVYYTRVSRYPFLIFLVVQPFLGYVFDD